MIEEASVLSGLVARKGGSWGYIPSLNRTPNFINHISTPRISAARASDSNNLDFSRFFFVTLPYLWLRRWRFLLFRLDFHGFRFHLAPWICLDWSIEALFIRFGYIFGHAWTYSTRSQWQFRSSNNLRFQKWAWMIVCANIFETVSWATSYVQLRV